MKYQRDEKGRFIKNPENFEKVKCFVCQKEFERRKSCLYKHTFCSFGCYTKYSQTEESKKIKRELIKKINPCKYLTQHKIELTCQICQKPFKVWNGRKDITKFCSRECYYKYRTGKPLSEEIVKKMREDAKKRFADGKQIPSMLHKKHKPETIAKMKIRNSTHFERGHVPFNKNKNYLEEPRIVHGEKIHTFNNWSSLEPYTEEFNRFFKEFIRQRDNLTCIKCGLFQDDCIKLYKRKLDIHHIDYVKENILKENCCALCIRCHGEVNTNRPHWTKFFQSLLSEIYDYKYENGNVILNYEQLNLP